METFPQPDPAWTLTAAGPPLRDLSRNEARFAQGNGYLGFRGATPEQVIGEERLFAVAGVYDQAPGILEVPEWPNLPDTLAIELFVDGERVCVDRGVVEAHRIDLDLRSGELVRRFVWTAPHGARMSVVSRRVASLADPHVVASAIELTPLGGSPVADSPLGNAPRGDSLVTVRSGIDGEHVGRGVQHLAETWSGVDGATAGLADRTIESGIDVVTFTGHRVELDGEPPCRLDWAGEIGRRRVTLTADVAVPAGSTLRVEKIATVHTSIDPTWTERSAADARARIGAHLRAATAAGYRRLAADSARRWGEFWDRHDVRLDTAEPVDQLAIRFCIYHLRAMTAIDDDRVGISAKGFTGDGYKGHAFWDTEVYILPFWQYTAPEVADVLVSYRAGQLSAARALAAARGFDGAMFPWESATTGHGEVSPTRGNIDVRSGERDVIRTGVLQHHITAVVAHAVSRHMSITGRAPLEVPDWTVVILLAARFWSSRLEEGPDGRLHVLDAIGPDEYSEHVDDNAFTLHLAHWTLREAARLVDVLRGAAPGRSLLSTIGCDPAEAGAWIERSRRMALAAPGRDGLIPQDRTYLTLPELPELDELRRAPRPFGIFQRYSLDELSNYQVSKQADLVVLFHLLPDEFAREIQRRNLHYYESKTLHDSSLSASMHALVAVELDEMELAERLWPRARDVDLGPHAKCEGGLHGAAMGGLWQLAVIGFAGVRIDGSGRWTVRPRLPRGWRGVSFRLRHDEHTVDVEVDAAGAWLSIDDRSIELTINDRPVRVGPQRVRV